jgi:hypothetical protein
MEKPERDMKKISGRSLGTEFVFVVDGKARVSSSKIVS